MFLVLLLLASYAMCIDGATADEWRSRAIFQVLTDRFALADNSTNDGCNAALASYCGGGWRGIINQLDYIQGMGFTAVWISPVTYQFQGSTLEGVAYHGYWQQDLYQLNSAFGSEQDLKDLAIALHARGMFLMLDVVVNHMAWKGNPNLDAYSQFSPFDSSDYFHTPCLISQVPDANISTLENCWLGDDVVALPDLRTESPNVASMLASWIEGLVANYSVDGLRIDSALNVEPQFFPNFLAAAGTFATGETMDGNASISCVYQANSIGSILNYPIYYPLARAFTSSQGSFSELVADIAWVNRSCSDPTTLATFSENHDVARFASLTGDLALAANILTYVVMQPGIPIVYYGAEQHLAGSTILSANRQALWLNGYNTSAPLYQLLAKLNALRNHAVATSNYARSQSYVAYQDSNTIAFLRHAHDGKSTTVTILTNNGADAGQYTVDVSTSLTPGTNMTNILSCKSLILSTKGSLAAEMQEGMPQVYYPSDSLDGSGLCGRSLSVKSSTSNSSSSSTGHQNAVSRLVVGGLAWELVLAMSIGWAVHMGVV